MSMIFDVYDIVSLACIAIMTALVLWFTIKFFSLNRAGKVDFIKNFKRGKGALIYVASLPMFLIANLFNGLKPSSAFFDSVTKAVDLIFLKFSFMPIAETNFYYKVAQYMCFYLVVINASLITVSIFHQSLWCMRRVAKFKRRSKEKCIIVGANEKSQMIYDSCHCKKIILDVLTKEQQEEIYKKGTTYKSCATPHRLKEWLMREVKSVLRHPRRKRVITVIINTGDEHRNLNLCGEFVDLLAKLKESQIPYIGVYVFGNREYEDVYSKYEEHSRCCLHYVNEYEQIAINFIDRYPLTAYMNDTHIDYKTSLVKPGVEINVSMIGFGRTNQQIFLSMVANHQFMTTGKDGSIVTKQVNYHLFDKEEKQITKDHKNLRHTYFRYKYTFFDESLKLKVDPKDYLELPEMPSIEIPHNSDDLTESISHNKTAVNYVIVSLGSDYDSIDVANKIVANIKEWKLKNTHVFVRIRDKKTYEDADKFLDRTCCHPFGVDNDAVYDYKHIIQAKFTEMAITRKYIYDMEKDRHRTVFVEKDRRKAREHWFSKDLTEVYRESNIYACLNLRHKLQLMNLDYCKKDEYPDAPALTKDEYFRIYAGDDMPLIIYDAKRKKPQEIQYTLQYPESRRKNMAMQEHQRWCAFMLMKGFIPATVKEILEEENADGSYTNGKNYPMRHHGNLTTYQGLVDFRRKLAERDRCSEEEYDKIRNDYQILDVAWWLLTSKGYKIVKRSDMVKKDDKK